jgi:hypothetical protein
MPGQSTARVRGRATAAMTQVFTRTHTRMVSPDETRNDQAIDQQVPLLRLLCVWGNTGHPARWHQRARHDTACPCQDVVVPTGSTVSTLESGSRHSGCEAQLPPAA